MKNKVIKMKVIKMWAIIDTQNNNIIASVCYNRKQAKEEIGNSLLSNFEIVKCEVRLFNVPDLRAFNNK